VAPYSHTPPNLMLCNHLTFENQVSSSGSCIGMFDCLAPPRQTFSSPQAYAYSFLIQVLVKPSHRCHLLSARLAVNPALDVSSSNLTLDVKSVVMNIITIDLRRLPLASSSSITVNKFRAIRLR
jgi:hypothetical protein